MRTCLICLRDFPVGDDPDDTGVCAECFADAAEDEAHENRLKHDPRLVGRADYPLPPSYPLESEDRLREAEEEPKGDVL